LLGKTSLEAFGLLDVERLEIAEPGIGFEPVQRLCDDVEASLKPCARPRWRQSSSQRSATGFPADRRRYRDVAPDDPSHTVYTNSLISVDAATGRLNWHYQAVPRDEHDWDLASTPTLYRTSAGKDMVAIAGKDGHVYGIDRATHLQVFKTAGTSLENNDVALSNKWMHVCPGLQGGAMFNGAAYSPLTGALFVGMADHCAWYIKDKSFGEQGGAPTKDWSAAAKLEDAQRLDHRD
jgi:hypothetical protein